MKIRVYTDGACSENPGPGGWAAVILFPEVKKEISGNEEYTTNNRMELMAVIRGLASALKDDIYNKVDVYSDSAYVVNAIKKGWLHKWKFNNWKTVQGDNVKNKDLWEKLDKLMYKHNSTSINFIKVKGHSNDKYNEICDRLAKQEVLNAKE